MSRNYRWSQNGQRSEHNTHFSFYKNHKLGQLKAFFSEENVTHAEPDVCQHTTLPQTDHLPTDRAENKVAKQRPCIRKLLDHTDINEMISFQPAAVSKEHLPKSTRFKKSGVHLSGIF